MTFRGTGLRQQQEQVIQKVLFCLFEVTMFVRAWHV